MENNKSSILAQFFAGSFSGAIFGIAGYLILHAITSPIVGMTVLIAVIISGIMLGIVIANKTKMTRYSRVIPWLGIGFFILPPVLLVGAIGRLTPKVSDPIETYFILLFMIGIMVTSIVLSALIIGAIKWQKIIINHGLLVTGIVLLVWALIVFVFFSESYWTLPALLTAAVFAIAAPSLTRLSHTSLWYRQYGLLIGGLLFVAMGLYGLIHPIRRPYYAYYFIAFGIAEILFCIFRRKKFVENLTRNSMDSNQKNSLYVLSAVVAVILLVGVGYFGFTKKSAPVAPQPTSAETAATEEATANWQIYQNQEYGFEFKHPTTLIVSQNPSDSIFFDYNKDEIVLRDQEGYDNNLIILGVSDDVSMARKPDPNCVGMCPFRSYEPLDCEVLLKRGDLDRKPFSDYTNDEKDFIYRSLPVDNVRACSQNIWEFSGESGAWRTVVFYGPGGQRFEFRAHIGSAVDPNVTKILTDNGEAEEALTGYPGKNVIPLLGQILSTFKFTN